MLQGLSDGQIVSMVKVLGLRFRELSQNFAILVRHHAHFFLEGRSHRLQLVFIVTVKKAMLSSNTAENVLDIHFVSWLGQRPTVKPFIKV